MENYKKSLEEFYKAIEKKPDQRKGIQFHHITPQSHPAFGPIGTEAIEIPSKGTVLKWAENFMADKKSLKIRYARTRLNPKDLFLKKVGRVIALDRIKDERFEIVAAIKADDRVQVFLVGKNTNPWVASTYKDSDKVYVQVITPPEM